MSRIQEKSVLPYAPSVVEGHSSRATRESARRRNERTEFSKLGQVDEERKNAGDDVFV